MCVIYHMVLKLIQNISLFQITSNPLVKITVLPATVDQIWKMLAISDKMKSTVQPNARKKGMVTRSPWE